MDLTLPSQDGFSWNNGTLFCENLAVESLAKKFGTPLYIYSEKAITSAFDRYENALTDVPHLVCYALKANSNLSIIRLLAERGAGFDIVSLGELERVRAAGGDLRKVVFSGVGKTEHEIAEAIRAEIFCFNVESAPELDRIIEVARSLNKKTRISFRVNPNVDAKTHPYISTGLKKNKFGVAYDEALVLYRKAKEAADVLDVEGIGFHIGSQITELTPYKDACEKLLDLVDALKAEGIELSHIDFGGGLGINYHHDNPPPAAELVRILESTLASRGYSHLKILFEAGRSIVGNAGALVMNIEFLKSNAVKNFCIVNAAMNDMIRPTLYQAWMQIVPVTPRTDAEEQTWDIVGPVCETGDWLGQERRLAVRPGDLLALMSAGAYGMSMASNYNTRLKPMEVLVRGSEAFPLTTPPSFEELFRAEKAALNELFS
jgi:diaminopimelate decarboxylase